MAATKIIYDRIFRRYDTPATIDGALTVMVANRSVCRFSSGNNLLTGYHYRPSDPAKAHGLIVLVPGFCAGGDDYLWQIRSFLDYGWGVFTFDPTGTLRSQGKNQVGFSQTIPDLEAALNYIENQANLGYNELVLVGHSRGGYAACCILAQNRDVSAVVSVSGVNSAMEAVMEMSVKTAGPVSYANYGFLWLYQTMLFGRETVDLQAAEIISRQDVPVLVIHGSGDQRISVDKGSIMAHCQALSSVQAEYLLRDGGHTDLLYDADGTANDDLMEEIHTFLIRSTEK
ncbi:MAG: alpha/beta fold hydrolase [Oscillospiraceae bacterium]|nr:alpha/beta fold hydrolase [Oscillospiraceae bacterium]